MRVTVSPDGEVIVETDDIGQAAALIRELRNGSKPAKKRHYKKKAPEPVEEEVEEVQLSAVLVDTWNWLVANDTRAGVATHDIAAGLGIKVPATTWRVRKLIERGLAYQIKRGYYRAGESG